MYLQPGSNSQAGQESFVLNVLDWKRNGFYVEIGAYHSTEISNTFVLESIYKWRGISLELDSERVMEFRKNRANSIYEGDATTCDYTEILKQLNSPSIIDYLQVDIEPARNSFKALSRILKTDYTFSVITFEHDLYYSQINYFYKFLAHLLLTAKGYKRIAANVSNDGCPYEDWYVHKTVFPLPETLKSNAEWQDLFQG